MPKTRFSLKNNEHFHKNLIKFFNSAVFTQRVKINDFSKPITGYFTFMTCDAKKCLAPSDIDFNFALKNTMTSAGGEEKKKEETPEPKKEAAVGSENSSNPRLRAQGSRQIEKTAGISTCKAIAQTSSSTQGIK